MKKILLFSLMLCASTSFATVRTVSNQTPNPGQYTTIQLAINAASPGDTIYVHGSNVYYAGFALDKQLTIIGTGFEVSSVNTNRTSIIAVGPHISINNVNASGSKIMGLYLSGISITFTVAGIHDFTINRCFLNCNPASINFALNMYNITIAENYIFSYGLYYSYGGPDLGHDFLITNNVFRVYTSAFSDWIGVSNVQVVNNLFYGVGPGTMFDNYNYSFGISGLAFSNNIFNKVSFAGLSACTFSNNITNQCTGNTPWINNGTDLGVVALGTQNIAATSPNFVNQANIDAGGYGDVNYFVVNPGSPTLSSMAGDPDMGPYGGSGSYNYSKASASTLPYVYSLTIGNPTIQSGTNLNIDVIGKKHD